MTENSAFLGVLGTALLRLLIIFVHVTGMIAVPLDTPSMWIFARGRVLIAPLISFIFHLLIMPDSNASMMAAGTLKARAVTYPPSEHSAVCA
jgi:hypothetical protein